MQLLLTPGRQRRRISSRHDDSQSWNSELLAKEVQDQMETRHDAQMLIARTVPADPYTTWLEQRDARRRFSGAAAPSAPARRFGRDRPTGRPWYSVRIGECPDQ